MEPADAEEDWYVDCSDDEKYSYPGAEKGIWEPAPKDIKELYEKLAAGEELTLTWSWPRGRRSPSPEPCEENMDEDLAPKKIQKEEKQAPTEFDFDDFSDAPPTALTPRRTPGSKTPRSTQKRVARMDKIMDDLRKEKKSMSPGQKTMVPGHRPLPGLGGAHRLTPKTGIFGSGSGAQRSPGSALAAGLRSPATQRSQPPAAAQPAVPSVLTQQRPPVSSPVSSGVFDTTKQTVGASVAAPVSAAQSTVSSSTTNVAASGPPQTSIPTCGPVQNPTQTVGSSGPTAVVTPSARSTEETKPTQAVTVVQPTPGDGTPQRPALPKLKIRKDLIS